jgi:NADH dehydrogenase FAD-containing subunit
MGNSAARVQKRLEGAPTVIIVGAGYGGVELALALDNVCNVVLIDRKDYFLHNVGTPRGMVDTGFMEKCMIPYTELLKNGHMIKGQVSSMTPTAIQLQGRDEPITGFDYLVIATGTSYCFPYKVPLHDHAAVLPLYTEIAEKIKAKSDIVCVGAGSTGLEAATEIACRYPDKKITIVHSRMQLFEEFKPAFGAKMESELKKLPNVTLIKGDRLLPVEADGGEAAAAAKSVEPAGGKVVTQNGVEIKCDLLFWCVGGRLNNASFQEHFGRAMNPNGSLRVDQFLQVEGFSKVFACGDICAAGPYGTVNFATQHAANIASSIQADMRGKPMVPFKAGPHLNATQLGTVGGAGCLPGGIVIGGFLVQKMKHDCFAGKYWHHLGHRGATASDFEGKPADVQRLQKILHMSEEEVTNLAKGLEVTDDPTAERS